MGNPTEAARRRLEDRSVPNRFSGVPLLQDLPAQTPRSTPVGRALMAGEIWLPPEVASYYGRDRVWHAQEFRHDPSVGRKNYYAALMLEGISANPQVWHFAYRDGGVLRGVSVWRHYGFVVLWKGRMLLFSFSGLS